MAIYAMIDGEGFAKAFYEEAVHGARQLPVYDDAGEVTGHQPNLDCLIPEAAVEISQAQWQELLGFPSLRKLIDGAVVEFQPPPIEPVVVMPTLTPRQFWLAASRIDVSKADVLALVDAVDDKQAAADLRIEITEAVSFERSNPAIDELAVLLGISGEQLDSLWVWAAGF
ncbi:hypothetical protein GOZ97_00075 [Agrobacterium vitis]|uniref:hypothetical protein n=1 Tax=Rhizobium/Agrobacterium group TaxID=227290 RepID=UPI0008DBEA6F|nr:MULTISPECIES: hypothetical protein [Rhizobium/Agrobacterium group]MCF1436964.1 hypothetical protein [Allorhizobium ampelinum]MCF1474600.1 hypothetical protein [Allorhizobium ampelinum]MUO92549.1 hypothetical protein [Agrobacterium vitis]MUZ51978.1 hypothetical protein [Agrobacterium vitis]MUZ89805.1 hypothetical protein [Agrobacterium vitis]